MRKIVLGLFVIYSICSANEEIKIIQNATSKFSLKFIRNFSNTQKYWHTLNIIYPDKNEKVIIEAKRSEKDLLLSPVSSGWSKDGLFYIYKENNRFPLEEGHLKFQPHMICNIINLKEANFPNFFNKNDLSDNLDMTTCQGDWSSTEKHTIIYYTHDNKIIKYYPINDLFFMFYQDLKNSNNKKLFTLNNIYVFLQNIPLSHKIVTTYNNIAYYLQKAGANKEAAYLLEKIIEKFPDRTVAYYNLGDAYWALGEKQKAIKAYTTYIEQMRHKSLQKKIPKVVLERVSHKK